MDDVAPGKRAAGSGTLSGGRGLPGEFDPSDLYGGIRDYTDERDGGGVSEWIVPFEAVAEFARRAED